MHTQFEYLSARISNKFQSDMFEHLFAAFAYLILFDLRIYLTGSIFILLS